MHPHELAEQLRARKATMLRNLRQGTDDPAQIAIAQAAAENDWAGRLAAQTDQELILADAQCSHCGAPIGDPAVVADYVAQAEGADHFLMLLRHYATCLPCLEEEVRWFVGGHDLKCAELLATSGAPARMVKELGFRRAVLRELKLLPEGD